MTADGPRFLDEEPTLANPGAAATQTEPPLADRLADPVLLEAGPDAPATLSGIWQPQALLTPSTPAGGLPWSALGIGVVLVSLAMFSAVRFVLSLGDRSTVLGVASGLALGLGVGLIGYGLAGEWRGYRKLQAVDRLRAAFVDDTLAVDALRAVALGWLEPLIPTLPHADEAIRAIRSAPTVIEIQAALRDRVADPLHQAAQALGRRAGLQAASLIAVSPHASWDGLIAGLRGLLVIRDVARLFGLRPGLAVTALLVRKVAWTAAGISGIELLSQSVADGLHEAPFAGAIIKAVPGGGVAALRLYRLANMAAEACCPVAG